MRLAVVNLMTISGWKTLHNFKSYPLIKQVYLSWPSRCLTLTLGPECNTTVL